MLWSETQLLEARARGHPEVLKLDHHREKHTAVRLRNGNIKEACPRSQKRHLANSGLGARQRALTHSMNILQCLWHTALGILQHTAQEPSPLKGRACRSSLSRKTQVLDPGKRAEPNSAINSQGSRRAAQMCTSHLRQNRVSILPACHQGNQLRNRVTHPESDRTRSRG